MDRSRRESTHSNAPQPAGDGPDLVELNASDIEFNAVRTLWRAKWLLGLTAAVALAGALTLVRTLDPEPVYEAEAQLFVLDPEQELESALPSQRQGGGADPAIERDVENTVIALRSPSLVARFARDYPTATAALRPPPEAAEQNAAALKATGALQGTLAEDLLANDSAVRDVAAVREAVEITQQGDSQFITITARANDAQVAADIANGLAQTLIAFETERGVERARSVSTALERNLDRLRQTIREEEAERVGFRHSAGLLLRDGLATLDQQLTDLGGELTNVRLEIARARAERRRLSEANAGEAYRSLAPSVVDSSTYTDLRQRESQVLAELADLRETYGDSHPSVQSNLSQLGEIRAQMRQEVNAAIEARDGQIRALEQQEEGIVADIEAVETEIRQVESSEVAMRDQDRRVEAREAVFTALLERANEAIALTTLAESPVQLFSKATVPVEPLPRQDKVFALLGAAVAVIIAAGAVLARAWSARGVESSGAGEALLGVPCLGLIPRLGVMNRWKLKRLDTGLDTFPPPYVEAMRRLYTALGPSPGANGDRARHADFDDPAPEGRLIAVGSCLSGEGKTSTALALSRYLASLGQRVVLVDTDLRRGRLDRTVERSPALGVADFVMQEDRVSAQNDAADGSGLHIIPAGDPSYDPVEVLSSERLDRMIAGLRRHYDVVVLDTAPLSIVSDTLLLARFAPTMVFVVQWRKTDWRLARKAVASLSRSGFEVAGFALNRIHMPSYARNGYIDSAALGGAKDGYYRGSPGAAREASAFPRSRVEPRSAGRGLVDRLRGAFS
ncbi:MAG: AAA family ATPase [Azospirillaceae bacterium]